MVTVSGYVERVVFRSEKTGYSVIELVYEGEELVLVGTFSDIREGYYIEAEGEMTEHSSYGEQLSVTKYNIMMPEDVRAVERYLASGAVKGVGDVLAARIVRFFGSDTMRVLEEEPERLSEIKGISERMAMCIGSQIEEKREMLSAMVYLQKYGIGIAAAARIYAAYGNALYGVIRDNPYRMAEEIGGIGFRTADRIAWKAGIAADSEFRIRCGLEYVISEAEGQGHMYLPLEELKERSIELLAGEDREDAPAVCESITKHIGEYLQDMQINRRIIVIRNGDTEAVYRTSAYYTELRTAAMLHDLNIGRDEAEAYIAGTDAVKGEAPPGRGPVLDEIQRGAVEAAVSSGLIIITGGPGTGKTTVINAIIDSLEQAGMTVLLAAPTGRAAKRMTEATGREARTIHRLLEVSGRSGSRPGEYAGAEFGRNEENPLEADAVIIDEMSMVDIYLMHALLKAVSVGTRLILVGDSDQLPSVGPGNVLRDMIDSGCINVVRLKKIYRQDEDSDIVVNAHRIIDGEPVDLARRSKDFLFIKEDTPEKVTRAILTLMLRKLPDYIGVQPQDIQVLTPTRKGPLGVENLNLILQKELNPPSRDRVEKELCGTVFRTGDKVMQVCNDYHLHWSVTDERGMVLSEGDGIFNGDTGIIREINLYTETLTVEYDEGRMAKYMFAQAEELELAYAVTVHKSQGSEYPAVLLPMMGAPQMLMTRNILYTAVTRARSCVAMIGRPEIFFRMAGNVGDSGRYSGLRDRIIETEKDMQRREFRTVTRQE